MALHDRDYMHPSSPGGWRMSPRTRMRFGEVPLFSVNTWIIVINVVVFIADRILTRAIGPYLVRMPDGTIMQMNRLEFWGHFSAFLALREGQIWRFISFQFLHLNFEHIAFNMFALWMFGPLIESYLGRSRYLIFYLLCGMAGAASYLVLWWLGILVSSPWMPLIGASAGIFGVLVAGAMVAPDVEVLLLAIFPMRLRTLAWGLIVIAVYTVFTAGQNAGGEAAHLGGAALGFLLIKYPKVLEFL